MHNLAYTVLYLHLFFIEALYPVFPPPHKNSQDNLLEHDLAFELAPWRGGIVF